MHSRMPLLMASVSLSLNYLYSPREDWTPHYAEEADNLFLVSLALGAMYIIASVIEIYGVISVSMVYNIINAITLQEMQKC